jgi:hypothetical protein
MNDGTRNAGLNDIAEQKKWLRATTHGLLTRFSRWRRRVKIGLVIGGGFIAGAAGVAANLLDPALKWQVYIFQIIGLALVFAGGVLMDFLDEGAADAIKRANELVRPYVATTKALYRRLDCYMFSLCSHYEARYGAAFPPVRGSQIAQHRQGHADVRSRRRKRVRAPAVARDRWQTGVPALRLRVLLRLPSGRSAALALQGMLPRFLGDIGDPVRMA